jgi:hypothetical protein
MLKKHLLKISVVLPLVAMSATAYAGSTITDKSYWPNEARQSAPGRAGDVYSAFAYDRTAPRLQAGTTTTGAEPTGRYQGGPKGR